MPPFLRADIILYSHHLNASFKRWTHRDLIAGTSPEALSYNLYHAAFVVVSHDTQADPVFRYANLAAQKLWGMDWQTFTATPSRLSAEPEERAQRERLLALAAKQGYVDDYSGVRVAKNGKRFRINDCILWNVADEKAILLGQAATFSAWEFLA